MKIARTLTVTLYVLAALEAMTMTWVVLQTTVDSTLISKLTEESIWFSILFAIDRFLLVMLGTVFFMIPVIAKGMPINESFKPALRLIPILVLPFLYSTITVLKDGFKTAYLFFQESTVSWFLSHLGAFLVSILYIIIWHKKDRSMLLIYLLIFAPILLLVAYSVYQNLFAYNWITTNQSYFIWHLSFLINTIFITKLYVETLSD